jgi:hypothetical protein
MAGSKVLHIPVTEKINRIRTFDLVQMRADRKDVMGQVVTILDQLLDEKFNGTIVINVSSGGIAHVQANEIAKIPVKKY